MSSFAISHYIVHHIGPTSASHNWPNTMLAERRVNIGKTTLAQCWPAGQTDVGPMLAANAGPM